MIVARVTHGIWSHMGVRFAEWVGAALLFGFGYDLHQHDGIFNGFASYAVLADWASQETWATAFIVCAAARAFALGINGTFQSFPHSPLIRICASWFAASAWTAFALGLFNAYMETGGSPLAWKAYAALAVVEMRNLYCARIDMMAVKRRV